MCSKAQQLAPSLRVNSASQNYGDNVALHAALRVLGLPSWQLRTWSVISPEDRVGDGPRIAV